MSEEPFVSYLHAEKSGAVTVDVHVVPNAKVTQVDGLHDGALRLRLHAPPVDGKANEALLAWLAQRLEIPKRHLTLLRGHTSRRKQVQVAAAVAREVRWTLLAPTP